MADEQRKPWDQLPDEPDTAYVRFLIYRDLGPARSLDAAYAAHQGVDAAKRSKTQARANGSWTNDSARYRWPERARAWDIALLSQLVPESAGLIFQTINEMARASLAQLQSGRLKPRKWADLIETVTVLAGFISPEVITATIDHAADPGPAAAPGSPPEDAGV